MVLDAAGVHWRWNGGSADVEWKNFIRFLECKSEFLLYSSPACFNILPKRALSPDQLSELRGLFAQNISSKR
jgi:YcxB-like protein